MINRILVMHLALLLLGACTADVKTVVCVGDSITAGSRHKKESVTAYPKVLGDLLGEDYGVINCGRSGTTALKESNSPYWNCNQFANVFSAQPEVITIKLGTNDSKPRNWDAKRYKNDYQSLIDTFLTINPQPQIYLCLPVPVYAHSKMSIDGVVVTNEILPIIRSLAVENDLPIIDLYTPMLGQDALVPDGVHPEQEGAAIIAETIYESIK